MRISEQTAMTALYRNGPLFIMNRTDCIYCAVGTESINTTKIKPVFGPKFMKQYISYRFLKQTVSN